MRLDGISTYFPPWRVYPYVGIRVCVCVCVFIRVLYTVLTTFLYARGAAAAVREIYKTIVIVFFRRAKFK